MSIGSSPGKFSGASQGPALQVVLSKDSRLTMLTHVGMKYKWHNIPTKRWRFSEWILKNDSMSIRKSFIYDSL